MLNKPNQYNTKNLTVQKIGKLALAIYIILSFITSTGFLPSVFLSLSLYVLVILAIFNVVMNSKIVINKYLIWFFLFIALSLCGIINTPITDWWSTFYRIMVIWVVCFSYTCFVVDKKDFYTVIYAFAFGATLLMLMLIVSGRLHEDDRLGTSLMDNANTFACMYMVTVMLSVWYVLYGDKKVYKIIIIATIVLNIYALLLSGGRKFLIMPFVFAYIALIFKKNKKGKRNIVLYTVIVALMLFFVYLLMMNNKMLYETIGKRMEGLIETFFGDGNGDNSSRVRKKMMSLAWERGWEKPIFGHGFDSFKHLNKQELGLSYYSHNNWTEIWYNYGLVGMFVYYGFYANLVIVGIKNRNKAPEFSAFIVSTMISIFIFEFGAVTYEMQPVQTLLCLAAIVENFKTSKRG